MMCEESYKCIERNKPFDGSYRKVIHVGCGAYTIVENKIIELVKKELGTEFLDKKTEIELFVKDGLKELLNLNEFDCWSKVFRGHNKKIENLDEKLLQLLVEGYKKEKIV